MEGQIASLSKAVQEMMKKISALDTELKEKSGKSGGNKKKNCSGRSGKDSCFSSPAPSRCSSSSGGGGKGKKNANANAKTGVKNGKNGAKNGNANAKNGVKNGKIGEEKKKKKQPKAALRNLKLPESEKDKLLSTFTKYHQWWEQSGGSPIDLMDAIHQALQVPEENRLVSYIRASLNRVIKDVSNGEFTFNELLLSISDDETSMENLFEQLTDVAAKAIKEAEEDDDDDEKAGKKRKRSSSSCSSRSCSSNKKRKSASVSVSSSVSSSESESESENESSESSENESGNESEEDESGEDGEDGEDEDDEGDSDDAFSDSDTIEI